MELSARDHALFIAILREFMFDPTYQSLRESIQHANVSVLEHSVAVAYFSLMIARRMRLALDERSLIRGALLHDFFLYDWHRNSHTRWHGFVHPRIAHRNACARYPLNEVESDIIRKHMFPLVPLFPRYAEAHVVSIADKICGFYETFRLYPKHLRLPSDIHVLLAYA